MDINTLDFDELLALYRKDPAALEEFRSNALHQVVAEAPLAQRPRLDRLIAQLDAVRKAASTPLEAACVAFKMMSDSVCQLHGAWTDATDIMAEVQAAWLIERIRR